LVDVPGGTVIVRTWHTRRHNAASTGRRARARLVSDVTFSGPYSSSPNAFADHATPRRHPGTSGRTVEARVTPRTGLRVAVATPSYPPELGGLGQHVRSLARALAVQGCETTVLTQVRSDAADGTAPRQESDRLRIVEFTSRVGGRRFGYAPRLRRYAHEHRSDYDVVHAFSYHAPVALAVSGASDVPLFFSPVFHASGHSTLARAVHLAYRPFAGRVFQRSEALLCSSHAEREDVLRLYPFCAPWAKVVPIAVDAALYDDVVPFETDAPVVLSAGRLDRYKRVELVVRAMHHVGDAADLVILGTGPDEPRLRQLVEDERLSGSVRLLGGVSDEDLRRWQCTASVVVSLSTRESFGLSLAEGITAGAAIVASDIPAHREMAAAMRSKPTMVTESETPAEVATALLSALYEGRPGRPVGATRAWSDVARDTIAVYEDCLAHPRRRR
jgi:glycosyltransferase involved in cell wall biosynthesis